jgi:hypothetical protein
MSTKFLPTRDNPYLYLLNVGVHTPIDFNAFRSVAPPPLLVENGKPRPLQQIQATFNWLAAKLGDGTKISRTLVSAFSLKAVRQHTVYRKFEAEPDNVFAFLLNLPHHTINFNDFLSVVPSALIVNDGRRLPRRELLKLYKLLCRILGNGTVIYRHAVAAFSYSTILKHTRMELGEVKSSKLSCSSSEKCNQYDDILMSQCGCYHTSFGIWCKWCKNRQCKDLGNPMPCAT